MDEMQETLKQDIIAIEKEDGINIGYWGKTDSKSIRVEPLGGRFRVIIRFWQNLKPDDDDYRHGVGMINEREIGGLSIVVPHNYTLELLRHEISRACNNRHNFGK